MAAKEPLLEDNTTVLNLLGHNPFPERPPRFVRFLLYQYQFSTSEEGIEGQWWNRELVSDLTGPLSRRPNRDLP